MRKTYVLDTNVLLSDTESIHSFDDNDLIIPLMVLEELDKQKNRQDEVGKNARKVNRSLDDLRKIGNLHVGVKLPSGGTLKVKSTSEVGVKSLPPELQNNLSKVDNLIVALALELTKEQTSEQPCILVSRDINVRVKCDSLGIKSEDYLKVRVKPDKEELYNGIEKLQVSQQIIDDFYADNDVILSQDVYSHTKLYPNQFLVLKDPVNPSRSAIARFENHDKPLQKISEITDAFGLMPRNKEQSFALDILFNPEIKLVTLVSRAGCGKTLLAVAAGIDQTLGKSKRYDKLVVTRPVQPVGKEIGFLPGTLHEKMEPWVAPIKDNLNFLFRKQKNRGKKDDEYLSLLIDKGVIEIEALTYIRGRSIPNSFIIIDEAQNLSVHELKTIITRVGDGTKIILTGDIEQIDHVHVDAYSNGLSYAVEKFKNYGIAAHVTLERGERSALATLASEIL